MRTVEYFEDDDDDNDDNDPVILLYVGLSLSLVGIILFIWFNEKILGFVLMLIGLVLALVAAVIRFSNDIIAMLFSIGGILMLLAALFHYNIPEKKSPKYKYYFFKISFILLLLGGIGCILAGAVFLFKMNKIKI